VVERKENVIDAYLKPGKWSIRQGREPERAGRLRPRQP